MDRRRFYMKMKGLFVTLILLCLQLSFASTGSNYGNNIKNITVVTEPTGEGQKMSAVIIEYRKNIRNSSLTNTSFEVTGRTVEKIYANNKADKSNRGRNGKFVIIELSKKDENALVYNQVKNDISKKEIKLEAVQKRNIVFTDGRNTLSKTPLVNNKIINSIVDKFVQKEFTDEKTGETIKYNLYLPEGHSKNKKYPLLVFVHDAGVLSEETDMTLLQGSGATVWAMPEFQKKYKTIVLAPQYSQATTGSGNKGNDSKVEAFKNLVENIQNEYSVDKKRTYSAGQSMGTMLTINANIKYPYLFAASLFIAGQWDAQQMKAIYGKNMWIVVSEGDIKAFPGMNESTKLMSENGGIVIHETWKGNDTSENIKEKTEKMAAADANIKYVTLEKGTVVPQGKEDNPPNNHMYTWKLFYDPENFKEIREWLFKENK